MIDPFASAVARGLEALAPPEAVLLAVSGGGDSVALLHAIDLARGRKALRAIRCVVGHVDHRLRPDSQADAQLARAHAERLGLEFAVREVELTGPGNLEEHAREARYRALVAMARASGCGAIVTAHTADDQAETLLWRLVRGAGAKGLGGMPRRRDLGGITLLRPMLETTRREAREFCARRSLEFRDDPTNENERPRARIRAEILPVLERLVPGASRQLAAAAERLQADDRLLQFLSGPVEPAPAVARLAALAPALRTRALAAWVELRNGSRRRLSHRHLAALERLVVSGEGEVELPSDAVTRCVAVVAEGRLQMVERPHGTLVREKSSPGAS